MPPEAPSSQLQITTLLNRIPLFAGLNERDLDFLARNTRVSHYEREQILFYQGDICDRVWVVYKGRVKIVYQDLDGREVILEIISPGEAFGGTVLFFPRHPATAKALEDCSTASFPAEIYAEFLLTQPEVTLKLLRMLGARHWAMINMQILAGERVELRMAHILQKLALRLGKPVPEGLMIPIPLSRQDLADLSGTTLETAIRTISRFNKLGMVETKRGGYLVIKDLDRLTEMAGSTDP